MTQKKLQNDSVKNKLDTDGDGVVDDDETEGCVEDVDCDDDGTGDAADPDDPSKHVICVCHRIPFRNDVEP